MEDVVSKRAIIAAVYDGKKWKDRVAKMTDAQVIAIHVSFVKQGKLK